MIVEVACVAFGFFLENLRGRVQNGHDSEMQSVAIEGAQDQLKKMEDAIAHFDRHMARHARPTVL